MVALGAFILLFGTFYVFATANPLDPIEIIIEKHIKPELTHYGLQRGYPPFISNFMQHGTNVFFKPQIMLSPNYAPGHGMIIENKEDCKKLPLLSAVPFAMASEMTIDEPIKIVETIASEIQPPTVDKVIVINTSKPIMPELSIPPMAISPLPAITEELAVELPVSSSFLSAVKPDLLPLIPLPINDIPNDHEVVSIPMAPELPPVELAQGPLASENYRPEVTEEIKPAFIPEAPELPPVPEPEVLLPPLPPVGLLPSVPEVESAAFVESYDNEMVLHIPEAPQLPSFSLPKLPVPVIMPEVFKACDEQNKTQMLVETEILSAPILPEFHEQIFMDLNPETISAEPILPLLVESKPVLIEDKHENIEIPTPPVLSPMTPISLPVSVVVPDPISEDLQLPLLEEIKPVRIEEPKFEPMEIPNPPVLSPMIPISLPVNVVVPEPISEELQLPLLEVPKPVTMEELKFEPKDIPAPPVLPPIAPIPLPISVVAHEPVPVAQQVPLIEEPIPIIEEAKIDSVEIPALPILSPMEHFSFPGAPILVPFVHNMNPVTIADESPLHFAIEHEAISNEISNAEVHPVPIPEALPLPTLSMPEINPQNIPVPPELPPFSFPSMPVMLNEPLYRPAELTPMVIDEPTLPQFEVPNRPFFMSFAKPPKLSTSEMESIISFPTSCVQNIVVERVLPNIVHEGKVNVVPPSSYPVYSPYSPTLAIRLY